MSAENRKKPIPVPKLWGLWMCREEDTEGCWVNHFHGPCEESSPMTFTSEEDARKTAVQEVEFWELCKHDEIMVAVIGVAPPEDE